MKSQYKLGNTGCAYCSARHHATSFNCLYAPNSGMSEIPYFNGSLKEAPVANVEF